MALEIRNIYSSERRAVVHRYQVLAARISNLVSGEIAGIFTSGANKGQIRDYDGSVAGLQYLGLVVGDDPALGQDGSTYYAKVQHDGLDVKRATVTGSGSSSPGDLVYASGPDPLDQLTMTSPGVGYEAVAVLHVQADAANSGTDWDIIMLPGAGAFGPMDRVQPGPVTEYTADGAITLPVRQYEAARLTGASSAAMTLAVPGAEQLGLIFTIYRDAGSGTHDVDYTSEDGTSLTFTFSNSGDSVTLMATTTTGWRRL